MSSNFNVLDVRSYLNNNFRTNDQGTWEKNEPEKMTLITSIMIMKESQGK